MFLNLSTVIYSNQPKQLLNRCDLFDVQNFQLRIIYILSWKIKLKTKKCEVCSAECGLQTRKVFLFKVHIVLGREGVTPPGQR